jgi:hypothetical protein
MNEQKCPVCNDEIGENGIEVMVGDKKIIVCCEDCAQKAKDIYYNTHDYGCLGVK